MTKFIRKSDEPTGLTIPTLTAGVSGGKSGMYRLCVRGILVTWPARPSQPSRLRFRRASILESWKMYAPTSDVGDHPAPSGNSGERYGTRCRTCAGPALGRRYVWVSGITQHPR